MSAVKWFSKLDRRIIYLIIALAIIIPLLWPMGLPIHTTQPVEAVYNDVDKLPAGTRVWIAFDYDPSSQPELQPMALAILRHCFSKKLRVISMTLWPGGPNLIVQAFDAMKKEYGVVDGTDFVNLGFKPGGALVIIGAGQSIKDTFTTDMFGKSTASMPILSDIKNMKQIAYCIEIGAGNSIDWWIAYGHQQYGYPLAVGCTAVSATQYYPYLGSKQITGLINGLKGAAEYETLGHKPGKATSGMDAQSITHIVLVLAIILANIAYFVSGKPKGVA